MVWYFDMYKAKIATSSYKIFNWKTPSCLEYLIHRRENKYCVITILWVFRVSKRTAWRSPSHTCLVPRRLSFSMKKCAQGRAGRRQRASPAVCTLPLIPCGSSPVARLYLAKNEAQEEEADLIRGSIGWNLLDPSMASARAYTKMATNSQALN